MEAIKVVLFEDPTSFYVLLGVVELLFLAMWIKRRTRAWAVRLAIPVAVALAIFGISRLVVTDREYIANAMREIADDCGAGSVETAGTYLDAAAIVDLPDPYGGVELSRDKALAGGRLALKAMRVREVRYIRLAVDVDGEKAKVHTSTLIQFGRSTGKGETTGLIWNLEWAQTPDGWRIVRVHKPQFGVDLLGKTAG